MYQIWLHLSCRDVNLKVCWTLHEREQSMFTELFTTVSKKISSCLNFLKHNYAVQFQIKVNIYIPTINVSFVDL